jgi:hypothetical protein
MLGGERLATSLAHAQQLIEHASAHMPATPVAGKSRRSRAKS